MDLLAVAQWRYGGQAETVEANPDTMPPSERKAWYDSEVRKRELQVGDRQLIPAAEVEKAVATAFAAISQEWQGLQDLLERRHGVSPQAAAVVQRVILNSMDGIADKLAKLQDPPRFQEAA